MNENRSPGPRIVMLGTGDFALPTFLHLIETGHNVVALVTQPDRPQGRKQEIVPSLIKLAAEARSIPVEQPEDVNTPEGMDHVRKHGPDLLVTAAYGQILSAELLALPPLGGINLHGSILPSYRGAAPVARAIQNGETETGVTVIRMTPRVDAGGMIAVARTPIDPEETAGELEARLAVLGAPLVAETLDRLVDGSLQIIPQDRVRVTKAPKLRKEDGVIDWSRPALRIHNLVRAMQPWPTASTTWWSCQPGRPPARLILHQTRPVDGSGPPGRILAVEKDRLVVAAGEGAVQVLKLQMVGKKTMSTAEFLRGHPMFLEDRFGS